MRAFFLQAAVLKIVGNASAIILSMCSYVVVERVDRHRQAQKLPDMLIGDRENETIAGKFAEELSRFRTDGTDYEFGTKLHRLLDTVHFSHSHQSRMLQLADLHTWLRQLREAGDQGRWHREQILNHISTINNCLSPSRYKEWPPRSGNP